MAWYKFEFRYGPGHQGRHEEYRWFTSPPDKDTEREVMEEIARDHYIDLSSWFCDCNPVEALPEKVRDEKAGRYRNSIEHAKHMLKILGVE